MFDAKELLNMLTGGQPPAGAENAANDASAALDRGKQIASDAANQAASTISNVLGQLQSRLILLRHKCNRVAGGRGVD